MVINVRGIKKIFNGADGEPDFHLEIPEMNFELGEVIYVMGHNGSGKSVFLKLMAGEMLPSNGYVLLKVDGKTWNANKYRSGIVRQKAEESLATDLTVKENLLIRLATTSLVDLFFPSIRLHSKVKSLINSHSELSNKLDQPCRNLSGGQRQTLAFLAVASQDSKLLFLDEFLAATDQSTSTLLRRLAKEYAMRVRACVFIVSHDVNMATQDADRIIILKQGRLVHDLRNGDSEWNEKSVRNLLL